MPEYFHKTTQIVCITRDDTPGYLIDDVKNNLYQLRESIFVWHEQYFGSDVAGCPNVRIDKDRQHEALGFSFAVSIILNRLLFCLDPVENASCEETAQKFASEILMIEKEGLSAVSQAELFMAIKLGIAKVTHATASRWREWYMYAQSEPPTGSHIMPRGIFVDWCQRMGWKTL